MSQHYTCNRLAVAVRTADGRTETSSRKERCPFCYF